MGVRGRTPEKGDGIGSWLHDKTPSGHDRSGWLAGDVHIFTCHSTKASKPCLRFYCGPDTGCRGCDNEIPVKPLGFTPLWRWDGKPVLVIIQEHHFEHVGSLALHSSVNWGRAPGEGEGIWIRPAAVQRKWETTLPAKKVGVDIVRACCVLWGMRELEPVLREAMASGAHVVTPNKPLGPREVKAELDSIRETAQADMVDVIRRALPVKPTDPQPLSELLPHMTRAARNGKK